MRGAARKTGWAPFRRAGTKQVARNPLRPKGCRGTAPPAALSLLDDAHGHRRRRDALHSRPWRWQRGLREFFGSLLEQNRPRRRRARFGSQHTSEAAADKLANRVEGKYLTHSPPIDGGLGHPEDDAAALVLSDRVRPRPVEGKHTFSTIPAHSCQENAEYPPAVRFGGRIKKHVYRRFMKGVLRVFAQSQGNSVPRATDAKMSICGRDVHVSR